MGVRGKSLRSSDLLGRPFRTESDPMASMGNLMDVMLVFACGLMVALIAHYNVNFSPADPDVGDMERLDAELVDAEQGIADMDAQFAEVGVVYRDIDTGELYVVAAEE